MEEYCVEVSSVDLQTIRIVLDGMMHLVSLSKLLCI